jgi:hypothetical protein
MREMGIEYSEMFMRRELVLWVDLVQGDEKKLRE